MGRFGVVVSTRDFFPASLAEKGRIEILKKLDGMGHEVITLSTEDTLYGAVESYDDAVKCAKLFKSNYDKIDGIIIVLPNFGSEVGVAAAIKMSGLNVPVLVQACDDEIDKMDISNRRDAFCGKISVCNNLIQNNIKFSVTNKHTCKIESDDFTRDIEYFDDVCRVVNGMTKTRIGAIGTRPAPFATVRFSEKLLQSYGITTCVVDLSEIIFDALNMDYSDEVKNRVSKIKNYGRIPENIPKESIIKQAKFSLVIEKWLEKNKCNASAIQCWSSIEENFGCAACLTMSMLSEMGIQSACEMDVTGALTMYALYLASGKPSGYLDWNNNYGDDINKCINVHCSCYPKSFFAGDFEISNLDVLGKTLGPERCFGACKGIVAPGPMTYAKITTDDTSGKIKAYVGEGEFTDESICVDGGVAFCSVPNLQGLMKYVCKNGFEHHVAMNRSKCAGVIEEALGNYLGWEIYRHN